MMVEDGSQEILKLLSSTSSKIAQGEILQLEYKGEIDILEETYFDIINAKTAALFAAATRIGTCIANKNKKEKDALEYYGRNIGLAFEIADDALDYYSTKTIFGKEIGKDFYEGKEEDIQRLKKIQLELHSDFINVVKSSRGSKLIDTEKNNTFTGEFWSGSSSLKLGLIDGIGNAEQVLREKFGEDVIIKKLEKPKSFLAKKLSSSLDNQIDNIANTLEERAQWQKFGL